MMCICSIGTGREHWLGKGAGSWLVLVLVLGLAPPADAQLSQFAGFPGEYAASRPPIISSGRPYTPGVAPYSYSPAYTPPAGGGWTAVYAPGVPPSAWASRPAPLYYGAGSLPGLSPSRPLYGTGYDAGLFTPRRLY